MPKFQNREEYEKWKSEKIKNTEKKVAEEIKQDGIETNTEKTQETKEPFAVKKRFSFKKAVTATIFIITSIYLYTSYYQPKKVAEDYLKAIRLYDYKKIFELSSTELLTAYDTKGILINLIDWKFIDKEKISTEKVYLDLSEKAFEEDIKTWLEIYKVDSVNNLPDFDRDRLKSYDVWRAHEIEDYKPLEEGGKYYYYKDVDRVECLVDITNTNKLGMVLKHKYILAVEKEHGKWRVSRFDVR